jgi:hypothetical protein
MSTADSQRLEAIFNDSLRSSAGRFQLICKICNSCPLKPLCYYNKYAWDEIGQSDLLKVKRSCPIRGYSRHKSG